MSNMVGIILVHHTSNSFCWSWDLASSLLDEIWLCLKHVYFLFFISLSNAFSLLDSLQLNANILTDTEATSERFFFCKLYGILCKRSARIYETCYEPGLIACEYIRRTVCEWVHLKSAEAPSGCIFYWHWLKSNYCHAHIINQDISFQKHVETAWCVGATLCVKSMRKCYTMG